MSATNATKSFAVRFLRTTILIGCSFALSASAGSLWVAESRGTLKLDALDGAVVLEIPESPYGTGAVGVDPTNGNVWTWGEQRLRGFDRDGVNFLDIESSSYPLWTNPNDLVVDGDAGNIWLNLGSDLYRLNLSGQVVGSLLNYGTTCDSMTLDRERSRLWLCTYSSVKAYDATFQEVASLPLLSGDIACRTAWDDFRDELWVAVNDKLRRYDVTGQVTFEMQNPAGLTNTFFLKPDGRGGVWLGTETQFVYIDPSGAVGSWITPFHDFSYLFVRDAVVHPVDASLWVGNETHLRRFSTAGAQLQERVLDIGDGNDRYLQNMELFEDQSAPIIEFSLPANNSATNQPRPTLRLVFLDAGSGIDDDTLTLTVNDSPLAVSCTVEALGAECVPSAAQSDGLKTVTAQITDTSGNESEPATVRFTIDTVAPQITISSPTNGAITNQQNVVILGSVSEPAALRINGTLVPLSGSNAFSFTTALVEGTNARTLVATDNATNSVTVGFSITLDTQAPSVPNVGFISVSGPVVSVVTVTGQVGSVEANAVVTVTNLRTGQSVAVSATADGAFVAQLAGEETDQLQIRAIDSAQNSSGPAQVAVPGSLPPDPATIATPLATTAVTPFVDSTAFLYTGSNPIQTGVTAGTIQRDFAAVIRGTVTTRTGEPLPNVRISVKDRPEFGQTRSRANGQFDLALNGSESIVINYERPGYLPVQRRVFAHPHDYTVVDNVILIQVDTTVTAVVFGSTTTQVHRSSMSQDVDGNRAATVVVLPGTTAMMRLPDGSSQPLASGQLRATEYSIGLNGRQAMPGELPALSAYTYAVELSIDEALQAGATRIEFSRPIPVYVENFLETPTGQVVPVGSFDRQRAAWIPEDDGRVIQILSVDANGLAVLDVDGSGDPATPQQLIALGIGDQERRQLALSFAPLTAAWRFQASHFSPWDCNWPYDFPEDFETPPEIDDDMAPPDEEENLECEGCRIDAQSQALQQDLSITGTGYGLHYRSDRQPRRAVIDVPVTDGTVPNTLLFVRATASIAGRVVSSVQSGNLLSTQLQTPQANLRLVYEWDGRDIYGRSVVGSVPVTIRVTYYYPAVFTFAASTVGAGVNFPPRAFAAYSASGVEVMRASATFNPNIPLDFRGARIVAAERTVTQYLDGKDPATNQIGGWTLTPHHSFDPLTRAVTFGDGSRQTINTEPLTIRSVPSEGGPFGLDYSGPQFGTIQGIDFVRLPEASTAVSEMCFGDAGNRLIYCGWTSSSYGTALSAIAGGGIAQPADGANARSVQLDAPTDVAAPDFQNVYFTSATANRVWRLVRMSRQPGAPWTLRLVAGTGTAGSTGDGGPAMEARLNAPHGVVFAGDGTVFLAESAGHRIRRIAPDGRIDTVAGDGTAGYSGDGGPAAAARLNTPAGLALGADGSLYVADQGNRRVRRIDTTGSISTVVGDGSVCPAATDLCGDNGPALNAQLSIPIDVAMFGDGRIAVADVGTRRIRLVRADGVITPYVGSGQPAWTGTPAGDPGAAGTAGLSETLSIAVAGRQPGSILVGDRNFLRAVDPPSARFVTDQTLGVPSMSGNEIFVFSPAGQHLETLDAVSRVRLHGFNYDAQGRLSSIADRSGNLTQIERTAAGAPTAIVSPYGQRTVVERDINGYLSRIENPVGEAFRFAYTPEGLMTRMEDPRVNASVYAYETDGRLRSDTDAVGGGWTLARTITRNGPRVIDASVAMTSAEGRTTRAMWLRGGAEYSTTYPDGTRERNVLRPMRNEKDVFRPDGTQTFHEYSFDRYFFPHDVSQGLMRERRPSGVESQTEITRTYLESSEADPLEPSWLLIGSRTLRLTLNGNSWTTLRNRPTRTHTVTSPEGRQSRTVSDTLARPQTIARPGVADEVRQYDSRGRLVQQTIGGGASARTYSYSYYQNGPQAGFLERLTDPEGRATLYEYDAVGRAIRTTLPGARVVQFSYDAGGNLIALTPPGRPPHLVTYSVVNEPSAYVPPAAGLATTPATNYLYNRDKQLVQITRPDSQQIFFNYNSAGKLETLTSPRGTATYTYSEPTGQLSGILDPGGQAVNFTYDGALPTVTTWTGTVSGNVGFTYNVDSWISGVSVNGQNVDFAFDRDGLLTRAGALQINRAAADGRERDTLLGVVATDTAYNEFGEVSTFQASRPSSSQAEIINQLRSELTQLGADLNVLWQLVGNTTARTQYNALVAASQSLPESLTEFNSAYSLFRSRYGLLRSNALNRTACECGDEEFAEIVAAVEVTDASIERLDPLIDNLNGAGGPQLAFSTQFIRDRLGRITQKTETIESVETVHAYTYDEVGRLVQVQIDGAVSASYTYDANGNRLSASGIASTYDDQDRLLNSGGASFTYTANGELRTRVQAGQTTTYAYDVLGNLLDVQLPNGRSIIYVVDGQNRRVGKRINGTIVQGFLYQGQLQVAAELDGSGGVVSRFVYGTVPNVPDYMVRNGITYRIVSDHVGSPRLVINSATGQVVQRIDYDTFGNVTNDTNPGFQPFGFAGGIYDRDTRLVRFGARDYDPQTGRWTLKDPLLFAGGDTNLYGYAVSDPVNFIDPDGLHCLSQRQIKAISGALGGAVSGIAGGIPGVLFGAFLGGVGGWATAASLPTAGTAGGFNAGVAGMVSGAVENGRPGYFGGIAGGLTGYAVGETLGGGVVGGTVGGGVGGAVGGFLSVPLSRSWAPSIAGFKKGGLFGVLGGFVGSGFEAILQATRDANCECGS